MRSALVRALFCAAVAALGGEVAAQDRPVTFEEPQPVTITGFAVGRADYDRLARSNSLTAGKVALSLFKPVGDAYFFGQLTTALEDGKSAIEIDNLIVSWTPHAATQWSFAFGRFDAPIGFERDDEPLNLLPTSSFNFDLARPSKLTGAVARLTASPAVELTAAVADGWNVSVDNNREKTGLLRAQWIARPGVTLGATGVYGAERDSSSGHPRALLSGDFTLELAGGRVIVGAETNLGRERETAGGAWLTWSGAAATGFARLGRRWGVTARYDYLDDRDGALGTGTVLQSFTAGPIWFFRSAQEGIFSNIEHTSFHLPQVGIRTAVRVDRARAPIFEDAGGALQRSDTRAVIELVYLF
jgi:putative OmpL-like beta-barrel porin-2